MTLQSRNKNQNKSGSSPYIDSGGRHPKWPPPGTRRGHEAKQMNTLTARAIAIDKHCKRAVEVINKRSISIGEKAKGRIDMFSGQGH